jgi:indole-3-glycerol phosphate synthase
MGTFLNQILAHKRGELEALKEEHPLESLREALACCGHPRPFRQALKGSQGISLIAEIKKASPSAGVIRKDMDPVEIARLYEELGAAAVSVITDQHFFQGSLAAMKEVKEKIGIPVLRKDFIIDPYQIYEARAFGADAVLLIVAALSDDELRLLLSLCGELGLEALVEIHSEQERERAVKAGADVIGINNRDLTTFAVDLSTTLRLMKGLPEEALCVSESGIKTRDDVRRLYAEGVDSVLIGTAFMAAGEIGAKVRELFPLGSRDTESATGC